jgi:hypothetical protein
VRSSGHDAIRWIGQNGQQLDGEPTWHMPYQLGSGGCVDLEFPLDPRGASRIRVLSCGKIDHSTCSPSILAQQSASLSRIAMFFAAQ